MGVGGALYSAKFWATGTKINKAAVDSFISESNREHFAQRLWIDTTGVDWNSNAENAADKAEPAVRRIGLEDLLKSPIDWSEYIQTGKVKRALPKTPWEHQQEAITKVVNGLHDVGSRGTMLMACGTGKTFTALEIAQELAGSGGRVLYLVPSLALMSQTISEWANNARVKLSAYAACSDAQVGRSRKKNQFDLVDLSPQHLAIPPTTNAQKLAVKTTHSEEGQMTVVFATYHSLPVISDAQKEHSMPPFDLAICDEAHRTTGGSGKGNDESFFRANPQQRQRAG